MMMPSNPPTSDSDTFNMYSELDEMPRPLGMDIFTFVSSKM